MEPVFSNAWEHVSLFLSGATFIGLVGHAVNTFPLPKNPYGQWLLGVIKFAVGQRESAKNALQGLGSVTIPISKDA